MGLQVQDAYLKETAELDITCVSIDVVPSGSRPVVVATNDEKAFEEITDYVLDRGHRDVVLLRGRENAQVTHLRQAGFEKSLKKHGISASDVRVLQCDYLEDRAFIETRKYIRTYQKSRATAFICMSDLMALGVCRAVTESGYRIPEDFSVTGFDGMNILEFIRPLITTVDQNISEKGFQGVRILMDMVEGEHKPSVIYVPHKLVERDSVKDLCR